MQQHTAQCPPVIAPYTGCPTFQRNRSEQFEARLSLVEVVESPSLLLEGMAGSRMPVVVSHGEGLAVFAEGAIDQVVRAVRYVDHHGAVAQNYPRNPNGSPQGLTGFTTPDGRFTNMMPHPERSSRRAQ